MAGSELQVDAEALAGLVQASVPSVSALGLVLARAAPEVAARSAFRFEADGSLTVLGFINGFLTQLVGRALVVHTDGRGSVVGVSLAKVR